MTYAVVRRDTDQSIAQNTWEAVSWETEVVDPGGFFSSGSPTRFTIPTGVEKVALAGVVSFQTATVSASFWAGWGKNGNRVYPGNGYHQSRRANSGFSNNHVSLFSGMVPVVAGDYFELFGLTDAAPVNVDHFDSALNRLWGSIRDMTGRLGAMVYLTSTVSPVVTSITTGGAIEFGDELYDDIGAFDPSSPSRLTVPSGVSKIRVSAQWRNPSDISASFSSLIILKNGSSSFSNRPLAVYNNNTSGSNMSIQCQSPVLDVVPGDYFEVYVISGDADRNGALADLTWFSMEVLDNS